MLDSLSTNVTSAEQFVLSFDGKLLRSGLTEDSGDIDMGGIEEHPTFAERKERHANELAIANDLVTDVLMLDSDSHIVSLPEENRASLFKKLQHVAKLLTLRIKEIRGQKRGKEYNIKQMIQSVGGESKWRSSKLVNAISRAKCELIQMNNFIMNSLQLNKEACLLARSAFAISK